MKCSVRMAGCMPKKAHTRSQSWLVKKGIDICQICCLAAAAAMPPYSYSSHHPSIFLIFKTESRLSLPLCSSGLSSFPTSSLLFKPWISAETLLWMHTWLLPLKTYTKVPTKICWFFPMEFCLFSNFNSNPIFSGWVAVWRMQSLVGHGRSKSMYKYNQFLGIASDKKHPIPKWAKEGSKEGRNRKQTMTQSHSHFVSFPSAHSEKQFRCCWQTESIMRGFAWKCGKNNKLVKVIQQQLQQAWPVNAQYYYLWVYFVLSKHLQFARYSMKPMGLPVKNLLLSLGFSNVTSDLLEL